MSNYEVGSIYKGKVTGVQPYGAFVALDEQTQGLVHISEVTHGFVKEIGEHIKVGDEVEVKVLSIDEAAGKLSLSIRATLAEPEEKPKEAKKPANKKRQATTTVKTAYTNEAPQGFNTLKEKLQEWIEQSNK
jgi:general stress protein 13